MTRKFPEIRHRIRAGVRLGAARLGTRAHCPVFHSPPRAFLPLSFFSPLLFLLLSLFSSPTLSLLNSFSTPFSRYALYRLAAAFRSIERDSPHASVSPSASLTTDYWLLIRVEAEAVHLRARRLASHRCTAM